MTFESNFCVQELTKSLKRKVKWLTFIFFAAYALFICKRLDAKAAKSPKLVAQKNVSFHHPLHFDDNIHMQKSGSCQIASNN